MSAAIKRSPQSFIILTYGCQMNVRDSETMAGLLNMAGMTETGALEEADVVILNTCGVRHSAENKVFGKLGEIKKMKKEKPETLIAVGGCMSQLADARKKLTQLGADVVFGPNNISELPELIKQVSENSRPVVKIMETIDIEKEKLPARHKPGISAFVNVMYGCNNFCSYCVVPYTRGRERSRGSADIIDEIRNLAGQGYKEITLLGQNVNSYGSGLKEKITFAGLLAKLQDIEGIKRFRFTTSHPKDISDELIEVIGAYDKICNHIHMPLQAGSDQILRAMNRGYDTGQYLQLIDKIRMAVPEAAITSDLIVGFPGEEDGDFEDTLEMVERIRFDAAFIFMYSPRGGTKAAAMDKQVPLQVKKDRINLLLERQYAIAAEINKSLENTVQEVLVEGFSKTDPGKLTARTGTNRIVNFTGPDTLSGQTIAVKITHSGTFSLLGEMCQ
ncbi:MAG: tRNA (N6-isopentenyl adenosine(37)-C2)-methylthiotransferase MiaB [Syntrophomonadaceae bacterium]|nr:tRNA (N6-isopentenyl adenosine(37)-C2)-methylthiotransferase MiaB [Syntrophomonadaceae bacterium]